VAVVVLSVLIMGLPTVVLSDSPLSSELEATRVTVLRFPGDEGTLVIVSPNIKYLLYSRHVYLLLEGRRKRS